MNNQRKNLYKQASRNLLSAIELMELGRSLMQQRITRELPNATKENIEHELSRWLIEQPQFFMPRITKS
jgi:Rv0078B-related antitoxin